MKSLEEHNEMRRNWHAKQGLNEPIKTGIECPQCKSELLDKNPSVRLASVPPKKWIECNNCDYKGYIVA